MTDDGPLLAITGSAKSGESLTLAFLAKMAALRGHPVVNVVDVSALAGEIVPIQIPTFDESGD